MKRILSLVLTVTLILSAVPFAPFAAAAAAEHVFVLPAALQEIEEQAFAGNTSITTLVVPSEVTSIGSEAFEGCTGLTEVSIASKNVRIANDAFKNCSREIVFYAYNGSTAMLWAIAHGYKCESLDGDSNRLARFSALISHSGFDPGPEQGGTCASKCLIVRTPGSMDRLPDISAYNPIDIFRSDDHLYYIQFDTVDNTEDCFSYLNGNSGIKVEPDYIGTSDDVSAQSVTIAEKWGTSDPMGFDVYAPFVAKHSSGSVTIAVLDTGVSKSSWGGSFSKDAISLVAGNAYTDSARHGSKVVSIINDCVGSNKSKITLLPIKVFDSSSMYRTSVIIEGIKHAYNHGANIINMSFGWDSIKEGISPEIEHQLSIASGKGILVVAAAGNGSGNVMFPASCGGVLAVSALTYSSDSGYRVSSRTGAIDYTAPGMYLRTSSYDPVDGAGDILGIASTSFAAPQITAALALIKLDSTHSGSATSILNSCCEAPKGLSASSEYGNGLPHLEKLGIIKPSDIVLSNMDGDSIPTRLWLADSGNDFMLTWKVLPEGASDKTITVTSSNTSVVSVRQYGNVSALITATGTGESVISVSSGDITKELKIVVERPVNEILITGSSGTMMVGKELDLAVSVLPENAKNRTVSWRSSNENVLTVTGTGHVVAIAEGTATVTCEATDGYGTKGQVEITVINIPDATGISLKALEKEIDDGQVTLEVGEVLTLIPTILPKEAIQKCTYNVFPKNVVAVSSNGVVTALETGAGKTATIVATATTGKNVYTGLSVTVVVYPTKVHIASGRTVLDVGETTALSAEVLPDNATDNTVTWESRNTAVATVNSKTGLLTAKAPGSAEIICVTSNGKKDTITITVRQPITITFDPAGGTCSETKRTAYSGYAIGALPTATKTYWTFDGWYTAVNGGTAVSALSKFTKNTTVYAHWTGKAYTVTFDANAKDAVCKTTSMSARVGTKLGTLPVATRPNYTFTGWYLTASGGEGGKVTADYVQQNNANLKLYAHWTANPYTIRFDPNGGKCATKVMAGTVGTPIGTLPEAEREYYSFGGWFTARTGGNQITEKSIKNTDSEITVYAHWTPLPYVMTFNANGGTCAVSKKTYYVDTKIGEPPVPTRPYYDFNGWYTGGEKRIHITASYQHSTNKAITVYADWTPHKYTMTLNSNGGNCNTESIVGTVDTPIGALPVPTRKYYDWDGWYTAKTAGSPVDEHYLHSTDANITIYAHWTPHSYTMSFDVNINGAACNPTTKQGTVDTKIGTLPTPTKPYYTFIGWFTERVGGTPITSTYVHKTDKPIIVYGQWKPMTYTMTFNANGGSCSKASIIGTVDTAIGSLPSATRELYKFKGWFTSATGGTPITAEYVNKTNNNITAYAHWEALQYTMKFNANDNSTFPATLPSSSGTYYADTPVGTLPTPTRKYHRFDGWFTAATGGTQITSTYARKSTESITVYAHWTPYTFRLTLNPGGGSCSETARTCSVGLAIGSLPTPTRDYYNFNGWYDAASGGNKVDASKTYSTNASTTIYAHWTLKPESGWVTEDKVPAGAQIIQTSWSYREDTEDTASSKSGWIANGSCWKQTSSGSAEYASFPSGEYDTNNKYYTSMLKGPYTASETDTNKREVENTLTGYIYWHWAINGKYSPTAKRVIAYKKGTYSDGWWYGYFYAIKTTSKMPPASSNYCTVGQHPSNGRTTYDCTKLINDPSIVPAADKDDPYSGLKTYRFYELPYYTSTYTDYVKTYKYYRNINKSSTDPGDASNISKKVKYVKYREK